MKNATAPKGGGFLLSPAGSTTVFTPGHFTAEHRELFRSASRFTKDRVETQAERIERKDFALLRALLREAGELGLLAVDIPEALGGLDLDKTSGLLVAEAMARHGSWSVTVGGQAGIGTLPIVLFGTPAQKQRYLPRIMTGEIVSAYALSEASSGSDALAASTRAVRSPDGKHWILNGAKQWITNAGFADVFIVFAKVDGEAFSAFIVDRDTPGFSVGAEEHKMGIRGSSTCPLSFDDARVPAENLLGEVGRGHRIAFNILNIGRLKLGVGCMGGCKTVLGQTVPYAKERKAFGRSIGTFGLIREKLARLTALTYVGEAMSYRVGGLIDERLRDAAPKGTPEHDRDVIAAVEEFQVEASILKVWGSEALAEVVDEAVQIHGGYGFVEEYPVERAYRDNRVNRIFEGTNEINRMLIPGVLLKRALKGQFPLLELAQRVGDALEKGELPRASAGPLGHEVRLAELCKYLFVVATRAALESLGPTVSERQEVLAALADVAIEAFAVDTAVARTLVRPGGVDPVATACTRLYAYEAHERAYARARRAVQCAVTAPAATRAQLALIERLHDGEPADLVAWRETIVERTLERDGYPFSYDAA